MLRFSRFQIILTLLACLVGISLAVPTLLSPERRTAIEQGAPSWVPRWLLPTRAITLGLDLQGGSHVLLEVDVPDLIRTQVTTLRDDVRRVLREERVALQGGIGMSQRSVTLRVPSAEDRAKLMPKLRELAVPLGGTQQLLGGIGQPPIEVTEGSDGAIQLLYTDAGINERVRRAIEQAIEVIRRRIDISGTTEPSIQRQGGDRILVQVPGLADPQQLKELLGRTAKLQFRFAAEGSAGSADVELMPSRDNAGAPIPVERRVIVEGEDLIDAQPAFDQQTGRPIVNFRFNVRGAQRFGQATAENVGRQLAIVLDNEVISAPVIQSPITGGSGMISGQFTVEAVNNLSVLLRAGALPARLTIVEERTVGPGLGADSIRAGAFASIAGFITVLIFMVVAYGFFGFIAAIALIVNVIFIFGLLALLGATLTLPGIAGIVLTIGMAVDSNVLIYERVREEQRLGRSAASALDAGFTRALGTIVDANLTTLIAAVVLFFLGTGPVRGFAVTLSLGIITTIFTAYTLTRLMVATWFRVRRPKRIAG